MLPLKAVPVEADAGNPACAPAYAAVPDSADVVCCSAAGRKAPAAHAPAVQEPESALPDESQTGAAAAFPADAVPEDK